MKAVSAALSILQNRSGGVPRPRWCTYLVTSRCNARCRMCDSWRLPPRPELTVPQVRRVFSRLPDLDVVRLSGGEPFLRRDLLEIAETILRTARPGVIHISTNGSLPERVAALAARFSQPRRLRFMVSFDGLAPEHDRNRGPHVSFARALETVDRLVALRRTRGVAVSANHTVITPRSLADHGELRALLAARGIDVHAVLAYADSAMYSRAYQGRQAAELIRTPGYPLHPALADADTIGFAADQLARVGELRDRLVRIGKRYYLRGLLARLRQAVDPRPRPRCVALRSHIRLLPNGDVPVCQFNTECVGNLLTRPLSAVWRGAPATAARAWVDACPGCWAECEVIPNAIYTGDLLWNAR